MKKIAILASSDALKPKIIIENLIELNLLKEQKIVLFTDNKKGKCVDYCQKNKIEIVVFKNKKLDDELSIQLAKQQKASLMISAGWPLKIPDSFFNIFKYKAINCHGSVLPDYRGSRSYMHYWANCEEFFGATIHYISEKLDDGNIIVQGKMKLFMEDTPAMVHRRTSEICAYLIPIALNLIEKGYKGKQIEGSKRYFYKLSPEEFINYRKYNIGKNKEDKKMTPHKVL